MTEEMTFLTDGADNVRNLAIDMSPSAEHLLDWFHLTMRLTVLTRYTKGLKHHDPKEAAELASRVKRIKWCLWHGKTDEALRPDPLVGRRSHQNRYRLPLHEALHSKDR